MDVKRTMKEMYGSNEYGDSFVYVENKLIKQASFNDVDILGLSILGKRGLYCIRLKESSKLPERYQNIIEKREHRILYIGKAEGQIGREIRTRTQS